MPKQKMSSRYPRREAGKSSDENGSLLPVPGCSKDEKIITVTFPKMAKVCDEKKSDMHVNNDNACQYAPVVLEAANMLQSCFDENMKAKKEQIENITKEYRHELNTNIQEITNIDSEERQELVEFVQTRFEEISKDNEKVRDTDKNLKGPINEIQKQIMEMKQIYEERLKVLSEDILKKIESLAACKASRYLAVEEHLKNDVLQLERNFLEKGKEEVEAEIMTIIEKLTENLKEFKHELNTKIQQIIDKDSEERQELEDFVQNRIFEEISKYNEKERDTDKKLKGPMNKLQKQNMEMKQIPVERLKVFSGDILKKSESLAACKAAKYLAMQENLKNDVLQLERKFLKKEEEELWAQIKKDI